MSAQADSKGDIAVRVLEALEDRRFRWRTVRGVAADTEMAVEVVLEILRAYPAEVVWSSKMGRNGEQLVTSRRRFREFATVGEKLIGAFKNRID